MDTPFDFPHVLIHKTIGSAFVWSFFQTLFVLYFPENCVRLNIFHDYQCGSNRWMNWKYGVSWRYGYRTYNIMFFFYYIYIEIYIICKASGYHLCSVNFYMIEYSLWHGNFMFLFRENVLLLVIQILCLTFRLSLLVTTKMGFLLVCNKTTTVNQKIIIL